MCGSGLAKAKHGFFGCQKFTFPIKFQDYFDLKLLVVNFIYCQTKIFIGRLRRVIFDTCINVKLSALDFLL